MDVHVPHTTQLYCKTNIYPNTITYGAEYKTIMSQQKIKLVQYPFQIMLSRMRHYNHDDMP